MPARTAHCKQLLVLLVGSLFRLVPSDWESVVVGVDGGVNSIVTRHIIKNWEDMGQTECLPCKQSRQNRQMIVNHHKQSKIFDAAACFKTPLCGSKRRVLQHAAAAHACRSSTIRTYITYLGCACLTSKWGIRRESKVRRPLTLTGFAFNRSQTVKFGWCSAQMMCEL